MSFWTSAAGKSWFSLWVKGQIESIWSSITGGDPPDLDSKVTVPDSFTTGRIATYNTTSGKLEDSGKSINDFVEDANYHHTDNNYTDAEKAKLASLEELSGEDYMEKLDIEADQVDDVLTVNADGQAQAGGRKTDSIPYVFELDMPVPGSYPTTYNVDTIETADDANRSAWIIASLGHENDLSQNRTEIFLVLLNNTDTPIVSQLGSVLKGTDFDDDLAFSINSGYLRISYTVTDGAENPTYLKLKIINL